MGRRAGSRNHGFFYRGGRGWYTQVAATDGDGKPGRMIAGLRHEGQAIRAKNTPASALKAAWRRIHTDPADAQHDGDGIALVEVCDAYLSKVHLEGALATYVSRLNTLFDLCHGLPARFRTNANLKPLECDFIHEGPGTLPVNAFRPIHLDRWFQAHPTWIGGRRTRIQAVKRAINYGVESGLILSNPIHKDHSHYRPSYH